MSGKELAETKKLFRSQLSRVRQRARVLEAIIARSIAALAGQGDVPLTFNAGPFARDGVLCSWRAFIV